jgi:sugar lactone lactonase YvrE
MNNINTNVFLPVNCRLGEGLHWDSERNALWFVDILNYTIYFYNFDTLELIKKVFDQPIGWVISIEKSEKILIGLQSGIALFNFFDSDDNINWISKEFPEKTDQRLNDAKIDKYGRLWFGSISSVDESHPIGSLARFNFENNKLEIIDSDYKVTNGPAFNFDNTIMLHNDSGNKITYKFQLDQNSGDILNKSIWRTYDDNDGYPDGMNFDLEDTILPSVISLISGAFGWLIGRKKENVEVQKTEIENVSDAIKLWRRPLHRSLQACVQ